MPTPKPRNDTPRIEAYLDITTVYHFQNDWRLAILQSIYHFLLQQKPTHPSLGIFSLGNRHGQEPISLEDKKIVRTEHFPMLQA